MPADQSCLRPPPLQHLKLLRSHQVGQEAHARHVALWPIEADDDAAQRQITASERDQWRISLVKSGRAIRCAASLALCNVST
jgi:hypothetical protein